MAERKSRSDRIETCIVAEREIQRFADDHAMWHKHVHNVELDPMQILKCIEMDANSNTIDFSCRRTGKTAIKELYLLKFAALNTDQEIGIVAPREAQAIVNLNYHLEAIRRSPILSAYIRYRSGRPQLADTTYQFENRSIARSYGIMAQIDGGDMTAASLEEVDDMPHERLYGRFLLMMGASRRLGASKESKNKPQIRITGVFKGADTLTGLVDSGEYSILPTVDLYLGIELGILQESFMLLMRSQLDPDEYIRQLLCKNVSARNLVWEKHIRRALAVGLSAGLELVEPLPGVQYRRRGLIAFGYDAGGHGENPTSSKHALVVTETLGNWCTVIYVRSWAPGADEPSVGRDIVSLWEYFRPDYAIGDAYGIGMITSCNDDLFRRGLIQIDRRAVGDGQSTATNWPGWAFAPMRFEGMTKHQMAVCVKQLFHEGRAALPYFEDFDLLDPGTIELRALVRQLGNIRAEPTKAAYPSYTMVKRDVGDDYFDALMAAVWALFTRGLADVPTVLLTTTHSPQQLLSAA